MSSPTDDAEDGGVGVETLKKRNAILKGGVVRLQAANQALEAQRQEVEAKYAAAQEELRQRGHEAKQAAAHTQRLEKRCQRLAAELQELKDAGRPSRGLLGGVFAAGPDPQLATLKEELEVAREELEQKIRENESVHIQLFEERQARDRAVRDLQGQAQQLEAALQGERARGAQLAEALRVAQSEERRLLAVVTGLRQELLAAEEAEVEHRQTAAVLRHYCAVLQTQATVDDRRVAAYVELSVNRLDLRKARRGRLAMEADLVTLRSITTDLLALAGGAAERLHLVLGRAAALRAELPPNGVAEGPGDELPLLQEELRSSTAGLADTTDAVLQLCRAYLDALAQDVVPTDSARALQAKLPGAFQRWLDWVGASLRLLVAALTVSPARPAPDVPPDAADAVQALAARLRGLATAVGLADDDSSDAHDGRPYSLDFLIPVADMWSSFQDCIQRLSGEAGAEGPGPAVRAVDVALHRAARRVQHALHAASAAARPAPGGPPRPAAPEPWLPLPPSPALCPAAQAQALPPHYLAAPAPYHRPAPVRAALRQQCRQFIASSSAGQSAAVSVDTPKVASLQTPSAHRRPSSASSGPGSGSEEPAEDLQDVDWDLPPCVAIDSPATDTPLLPPSPVTLPQRSLVAAPNAPSSQPTCSPFDPLDPPPLAGEGRARVDALARRVLQLYDLPDVAAGPGMVPSLPEDQDYWAEQQDAYLALLRLADAKAVEFRTEYHRAVLEIEEKCQQVTELQEELRRAGRERAVLQEELAGVRRSYDQQIAVLSDHLADLNARVAGGGGPKRK